MAERRKAEDGTHNEILPSLPLDLAAIETAFGDGDYTAFRTATLPYEEEVRKRIGRWVQRYPEWDARIGNGVGLEELTEEVFLMAFDQWDKRPEEFRFGTWLESLIDPAVRAVMEHPDEELENIAMARSAREAEQGPEIR